jgi:hypothetical protein
MDVIYRNFELSSSQPRTCMYRYKKLQIFGLFGFGKLRASMQ